MLSKIVSVPVASVTCLLKCVTSIAGGWVLVGFMAMMGSANAANTAPVILVLGDSLSAEYGIKRGSGWVNLVSERLKQEKFPWQVVNASVSGETTSGGIARLPGLLRQHSPWVVVIALGANDGLRGFALNVTRKNLWGMADMAQKAGAKVLLIGMELPPNFGPQYTRDFARLFRELAQQRKTALVPFLLDGIAQDLSYFQDDRIHPNERAQPRLFNNVWPALMPLVKMQKE